jgi:malonyl-CoA decarboxylase
MNTTEWISRKVSKLQEVITPLLVANASKRTLEELKAIIDPRVSEVEGGKRAKRVADWYAN